jgi:hypothetical protein
VKRRSALLAASILLAAAATGSARAANESTPVERFRFHAGARLLAPAGVGADGTICVGTADGYIHLLAPEGDFRWSYSVHGAVTHRPVLAGQLWFIATSADKIYALTTEGTLYWVFRPPSPPVSELAPDAKGVAYFVAADHFLYGVSSHGGVALRVPFGELKAGPVSASDGAVWAENQAGNLIRVAGQDVRRSTPGAPLSFDFSAPDRLCDSAEHEWRTRDDGVLEYRLNAAATPIAIGLTSAPLFAPVWSASTRSVVVSARDGLVVAFTAPPAGEP